jgi:CheY-like chemotaxis protein
MAGPLRVLIVEDEMMIAMMLEDMLADLGHQVAAVAMRLPQAVQYAKDADIDLAILDVNLDGRMSFPVAEILRARGISYFFASGYGSPGLEEPYIDDIIVRKPFESGDIAGAIARAKP